MGETRLPKVGERVRFRDGVERSPDACFAPGRTAVVVGVAGGVISARVEDMTDDEAAAVADWGGCIDWIGAARFWDECEPLGE